MTDWLIHKVSFFHRSHPVSIHLTIQNENCQIQDLNFSTLIFDFLLTPHWHSYFKIIVTPSWLRLQLFQPFNPHHNFCWTKFTFQLSFLIDLTVDKITTPTKLFDLSMTFDCIQLNEPDITFDILIIFDLNFDLNFDF